MDRRRTRGTGIAFERSLRRRIFFVAGVILVGSVSSTPSASATLAGEAAGAVGSTLRSVHATANAAPSLPSVAPPATPPAPAAPQAPAPAAPQVPVELPSATPTPSPSPTGSGSGADVPSVDGIAGAAGNSVGSVTRTGRETPKPAAAPARNDGGRVPVSQSAPDAGASKATPRASGTASSAPPSVRAAEVASLQRWFAYIWPAIPLGGGEAGREWAAWVIEGDLFRPAIAAIARLLSLVPPTIRAVSDSPLVGPPATATAPQPAPSNTPPNIPAPADGKRIIYFIALAALLALLAFTLWREFRSTLRAGVR
jgi:hypothetical protein